MASPIITQTSSASARGYETTHHNEKSTGFHNPWDSFVPQKTMDIVHLLREFDRKRSAPPPVAERVPVHPPDFEAMEKMNNGELVKDGTMVGMMATWLGHAAVLVSLPKINVLFDPCFSDRCSPVQWMGPKRSTPPPCKIADLPKVDVVVISHNHYDHLDVGTIKDIIKTNPDVWFFVPLGNKQWLKDMGIHNAVECDWWDEYKLSFPDRQLPNASSSEISCTIACTPCQHFTGRSLTDRNRTLWSSWVLQTASSSNSPTTTTTTPTTTTTSTTHRSFFFGGDTGYRSVPSTLPPSAPISTLQTLPSCPAFSQIGTHYGPFTLAAIPIGAYSPRWFMSPVHCSPEDAVCVHRDVKSEKSFGIHWGTWTLTDEPYWEPKQRLESACEEVGVDNFHTIEIGQSLFV
ncbi:beta-lactamase superfamily domain-containing protein [Gaertneriomyces semiglobifer]|nr:beta-lactamase superfamily domain-containing protein [Gaertneriomyces semiglobifer]